MKKIIAFSLSLVFIMMLLIPNVYATSSYNVELKAIKNEGEVVVNVELSNVNVEKGLIAFGATLDYDKNILEYKEVKEGKWATPFYNTDTGKLVTERNGLTKDNEEMFSIVFKAKVDLSNQNTTVTLKNIEASDGQSDIKTEDKSIQIGDVPVEEPKPPIPPSDDNQGEDNQGGNSQGGNNQEDNNLGSDNVESSSNNSTSTTNNNSSNSSSSSKVKTPSSGDMLPVIAIGVILVIVIANVIVIVIRKKKKSEEN